MRKFYLLILVLSLCNFSFAQVAVTATSGTLGPVSYTTLKGAFDAINAGTHAGAITINVTAGTTETATAVLNASGTGSSSYTSVLVQPSGGAAITIAGDIAGSLIDLDGADNVTINGLNTGGNSLTIANTNIGNLACTIRFLNDASDNTITKTTLQGSGNSTTVATVFFGTGTVTGNDNININNCNIAESVAGTPVNAILSIGSATAGQENSNITITNNNISNFFSAAFASTGIQAGAGNTNWTITDNRFYQAATRTATAANTHRVIQVSSGSGYTINNNVIGYASSSASGVYTMDGAVASKFVAIELNVGTTSTSNVQGNTISNISFVTTSNANAATFYGVWCGVYVIAGNVNVVSNTIGSTTGTGSIVVSPTVNNGFAVAISSTSTGTLSVSSNLIGAIDYTPSGVNAGTLAGIYTSGAGGTISISDNIIGNATANNMRIGVSGVTTQSGIIRGILNSNSGTVNIYYNTIRNMVHNGTASTTLLRGIESQAGTGSVSRNTISNMSAGGTFANFSTQVGVGILISSTGIGIVVDSNTVYNLSLTNAGTTGAVLSGIYAGVPTTSAGSIVNGLIITRNRIYNLNNANAATSTTAPAAIIGVYCGNANSANPMIIANNMIALGSTVTSNCAVIGIMSHYASAQNYTARIYHNTVDIEGTVGSGAQPSFAYYRGDFSATVPSVPTVDIKNNIFINNRSGGTGKHYGIANGYNVASGATGWAAGASDYNVIRTAAETTQAYWNGDHTLSTWQAASSGDTHSNTSAISFVNAPSDLHLVTTANGGANNTGTPLASITNDIDGDTRNATDPDMGADEFSGPLSVSMEYFTGVKEGSNNLLNWKMGCTSPLVRIEIGRSNDGKNFTAIGNITATKERCATPFSFADTKPAEGINYYRLKITEADGAVTYSNAIVIINRSNGIRIVSLSPTIIASGSATLQVSSAKKDIPELLVTDMQGKLLLRKPIPVNAGTNNIVLNLGTLPAGNYLMQVYSIDGSKSSVRFIKQ